MCWLMDVALRPLSPQPWQQACWERLHKSREQGLLSHAQLLFSPPDSGLEGFAYLFARYLLCQQPKNFLPCGVCRDCQLMDAGTHPAYQEITFEVNEKTGKLRHVITVDQIRELINKLHTTTLMGSCKVVIIHPAEDLMPHATNSLLKILEEPPANTYFLLVSFSPSRLLATIRSRCQQMSVPLPSIKEADSWLVPFISDPARREKLLALSGGNPVVVKQWHEQSVADSIMQLGHALQQLREGRASPLQLAAQWHKQGALACVVGWWRWLSLQIKEKAKDSTSVKPFLIFMDKLIMAKTQLESTANPNEQLLLESLFIDWQNLRP